MVNGLHLNSAFIQSALQYCLTFTQSCIHPGTPRHSARRNMWIKPATLRLPAKPFHPLSYCRIFGTTAISCVFDSQALHLVVSGYVPDPCLHWGGGVHILSCTMRHIRTYNTAYRSCGSELRAVSSGRELLGFAVWNFLHRNTNGVPNGFSFFKDILWLFG